MKMKNEVFLLFYRATSYIRETIYGKFGKKAHEMDI